MALSLTTDLVIFCPACKTKTKPVLIKILEGNDREEDEEEKHHADILLPPKMSNHLYGVFCHEMTPKLQDSCRIATISRIPSHVKGVFFKKPCVLSDRMFRVFYYFHIDHEKQSAGMTFLIGKEVH